MGTLLQRFKGSVSRILFWLIACALVATAGPSENPDGFRRLPMRFEPNAGQSDPEVKFLARGRQHTLFLTAEETVLALRKPHPNFRKNFLHHRGNEKIETEPIPFSVIRMQLVGGNMRTAVTGEEPLD